jgi:cysteine desulfurase
MLLALKTSCDHGVMKMKVYLDNSATTLPLPEVLKAMTDVLEKYYGNPSSLHHIGVEAERLLHKAHQQVAQLLGVKANEIIFTSGGTESNNIALKGIAFGYRDRGKHIITTDVEHASVYEACKSLEHFGFEVTYLPVNAKGQIRIADLERALRPDTILVSVMHVNNEVGSVQPLREIGNFLKRYPKIFFHVDAVQSVGKVPLAIRANHIDLLSLSGHKIHAPKGTGCLYVSEKIKQLYPLFHGGAQEQKVRPGTENVAGSVALAKALRLILEREEAHIQQLRKLQKRLVNGLRTLPGLVFNTPELEDDAAPHILNFSVPGIKPEVIVHALEEKGIYVSTKSACSSKKDEPSRVVYALAKDEARAKSAIRVSFSILSTAQDVDQLIAALDEIIPYYQNLLKVDR